MEQRETRASLLSRLRDAGDDAAWREFDDTYRELIVRYCRARRLQAADAEDVRQIVMFNLSRALRTFDYDPARGRFRHYLCRTVRHAIFQHQARPNDRENVIDNFDGLAVLESDDAGDADDLWEREWMDHHYRLAMKTIRATFEPRSVEAFDKLLSGAPVDRVAEQLGMTTQAVHKVKQRIRDRMMELVRQQIRDEDEPI